MLSKRIVVSATDRVQLERIARSRRGERRMVKSHPSMGILTLRRAGVISRLTSSPMSWYVSALSRSVPSERHRCRTRWWRWMQSVLGRSRSTPSAWSSKAGRDATQESLHAPALKP